MDLFNICVIIFLIMKIICFYFYLISQELIIQISLDYHRYLMNLPSLDILILIFILARHFNFENTKIKFFFIFSISFMIILTGSFSVYFIFASLYFSIFFRKNIFDVLTYIFIPFGDVHFISKPLVQEIVQNLCFNKS